MRVFTDPILIKMNRRSCPYTENMGQRKSVFSHILDKVLFLNKVILINLNLEEIGYL